MNKKPCPFCGESDQDNIVYFSEFGDKTARYYGHVWCGSCNASGPDQTEKSEADTMMKSIEAWNKRQ